MCLILALREEVVNGLIAALDGFTKSEVKSWSSEDLRVEEVLALLPQNETRTEVYQFAQQFVAALILEEDVSRLDVSVKDCIPLQEANCFRQLLENSDVLQQSKVIQVVMRIVCYFSEEISRLKPCHYCPLGYSFNRAFVDIEIVFTNVGALQVAVNH